ncbi:intron-binding protein aquarius [Carpediemonas membranifera]|uniref:Intron-binding protein aquarius n=1 Tax=Carpediemonas membranifera TaxID=201153 RepID=A0A8J6E2E4_9EUKA|nr:intron-binding protein aquarius [Carpediemonas membranifera]|eukprot:KAG9394226.1 intron-binding protein aquarius [Carpediemonas membranifera]
MATEDIVSKSLWLDAAPTIANAMNLVTEWLSNADEGSNAPDLQGPCLLLLIRQHAHLETPEADTEALSTAVIRILSGILRSLLETRPKKQDLAPVCIYASFLAYFSPDSLVYDVSAFDPTSPPLLVLLCILGRLYPSDTALKNTLADVTVLVPTDVCMHAATVALHYKLVPCRTPTPSLVRLQLAALLSELFERSVALDEVGPLLSESDPIALVDIITASCPALAPAPMLPAFDPKSTKDAKALANTTLELLKPKTPKQQHGKGSFKLDRGTGVEYRVPTAIGGAAIHGPARIHMASARMLGKAPVRSYQDVAMETATSGQRVLVISRTTFETAHLANQLIDAGKSRSRVLTLSPGPLSAANQCDSMIALRQNHIQRCNEILAMLGQPADVSDAKTARYHLLVTVKPALDRLSACDDPIYPFQSVIELEFMEAAPKLKALPLFIEQVYAEVIIGTAEEVLRATELKPLRFSAVVAPSCVPVASLAAVEAFLPLVSFESFILWDAGDPLAPPHIRPHILPRKGTLTAESTRPVTNVHFIPVSMTPTEQQQAYDDGRHWSGEARAGADWANAEEAEYAVALFMLLRLHGVAAEGIAIGSPYQGQVEEVRRICHMRCDDFDDLFMMPCQIESLDRLISSKILIVSLCRTVQATTCPLPPSFVPSLQALGSTVFVIGKQSLWAGVEGEQGVFRPLGQYAWSDAVAGDEDSGVPELGSLGNVRQLGTRVFTEGNEAWEEIQE